MLFNALSPLAFVALAGHAIADPAPQPYQMDVAKMSVRDIFGLQRRDDGGEYQPAETLCGSGTTCAEACGKGFEQCGSQDDQVHCFNPTVGQTCCQGGTNGNACDEGYYCANDGKGATWCCMNGDEACGGKIPASLISSATPEAITSSSSSSSSVASSVVSSSSSSSSLVLSSSSTTDLVVPASTTSFAAAISSHPAATNCTTYTTKVIVPISEAGASSTYLITSASNVSPSLTSASASATNSTPVTASSNNQRPVVAFVLGAAALAALAL
ncbi:hypothetical protein PG993_002830 [Apiospora rasikravindrae]|uniref:Uncharacterized protein n=1 Tax=Apiospora rasikravindrae TaxID=990691 RepID=A0ABR1TXS6_9PEZI